MKNIKFTIFTPTYNRSNTLERLYISLKNQTFKNFEWLIVDDGSTDNTKEIVQYFINEKKIKIRYVYKENSGKQKTYNRGIDEATGELFICIDSDDWYEANALRIINRTWNNLKEKGKFCGVTYLSKYENGEIIGTKFPRNKMISNHFEIYNRHNVRGDKGITLVTQILKKNKFPEIDGEKFITEATLYNRLSVKYQTIYLNEVLEVKEYQENGLSSKYFQLLIDNPKGSIIYYSEFWNHEMTFKAKLKSIMYYIRFSLHDKINFKEIIKKSRFKGLTFLSYFFVYYLYKKDLKTILFVGNLFNNNGPSNVNRELYKELSKEVLFLESKSKKNRFIEFLKKFKNSEVINISGISSFNVLVLLMGRLFLKKTTYLMHGALEYEKKYKDIKERDLFYEKIILKNVNKVICVSKRFKEELINNQNYNSYESKFITINNGSNLKKETNYPKQRNLVLVVGGGRPEKQILNVCKALNNMGLKLIVVGADGRDSEEIKKYDFVEYKGKLEKNELNKIMEKSYLYIQNSIYEPFGLAPLEALSKGCNLVISEKIGMIDSFDEFPKSAIVSTENNIEELKIKVKQILKEPNGSDIKKKFNVQENSWKRISKQYLKLWKEL